MNSVDPSVLTALRVPSAVDGFIVDARALPADLLAEAHRRGLVPDPAVLEAEFAKR